MKKQAIPFWQVDMEEKVLVEFTRKVLLDKSFSMGAYVAEFEKQVAEYLDVKHVIACTSGSDSILMALISLGIKPGDVVLTNDRAWIAAAHACNLIGAKIRLVDVNENKPTINLQSFKRNLDKNVKAVVLVHMNGRHNADDLEEILKISRKVGIPIIEDAAQGLGCFVELRTRHGLKKKPLGTLGDVGCFSLSTAKIVGAGQGGFCVTNNSALAKTLRLVRLHGCKDVFNADWKHLGFNFRLTDFHASIASYHLQNIERRKAAIKKIQLHYSKNLISKKVRSVELILNDFECGEFGPYIEAVLTQSGSKVRNNFIAKMKKNGVEVRPFYPSITRAKYLNLDNFAEVPNSKKFCNSGIYLPSGPKLKLSQIEYVVKKIKKIEDSQ